MTGSSVLVYNESNSEITYQGSTGVIGTVDYGGPTESIPITYTLFGKQATVSITGFTANYAGSSPFTIAGLPGNLLPSAPVFTPIMVMSGNTGTIGYATIPTNSPTISVYPSMSGGSFVNNSGWYAINLNYITA